MLYEIQDTGDGRCMVIATASGALLATMTDTPASGFGDPARTARENAERFIHIRMADAETDAETRRQNQRPTRDRFTERFASGRFDEED